MPVEMLAAPATNVATAMTRRLVVGER
jgi:hypothetical protein